MMKRITVVAAGSLVLVLAGCGVSSPSAESKPSAPAVSAAPEVPAEFTSALKSAENYLSFAAFSKKGLLQQLTSDAGDKFSAEAGRYAVDTVEADWNAEALEAAKNYQDSMNMSPDAIRDQLSSELEGYTPEEVEYALTNL